MLRGFGSSRSMIQPPLRPSPMSVLVSFWKAGKVRRIREHQNNQSLCKLLIKNEQLHPSADTHHAYPPCCKTYTIHTRDLTTSSSAAATTDGTHEVVITLVSDATFVQLLSTALQSLSAHLPLVQSNFLSNLDHLSKDISSSARPMSSISSFRPHSATSDPRSVQLPLFVETRFKWSESDLYLWREIFQVYIDSSPFESISERDRGERTLTECEERLRRFAEKVTKRGLERKMKMKQSRDALGRFLELNVFIMNLRKASTYFHPERHVVLHFVCSFSTQTRKP